MLKSRFGWSCRHVVDGAVGAQVLFRRLPLGLTLGYVPKGPLGAWLPQLQPALDQACHAQNAFALKVEPDQPWSEEAAARMAEAGYRPSPQSVQPPRTLVVSLEGSEQAILGRMSQKTRYNIRLAGRHQVVVKPWRDLEAFGAMMAATGRRDGFSPHSAEYYRTVFQAFNPRGMCELLCAEFEGKVLAAVMVFASGRRAYYFYGASTDSERQRMPTYLLQWEAMRWARNRGCTTYDLWGVPDADLAILEADFARRRDGLWGVYRFKRGFGGQLIRSMGAWDKIYSPLPYAAYRLALKRMAS
jgi:peptidoglycan pentaglycine glycine transferase (the first glycine)